MARFDLIKEYTPPAGAVLTFYAAGSAHDVADRLALFSDRDYLVSSDNPITLGAEKQLAVYFVETTVDLHIEHAIYGAGGIWLLDQVLGNSDAAVTAQVAAEVAQALAEDAAIETAADRVQTGTDVTAADLARQGAETAQAAAIVAAAGASDFASTATTQASTATIKADEAAAAALVAEYWAGISTITGELNSIGVAGAAGFGVGIAPPAALFDGMTALYGHTDPTHPNYGNYQFSDGSIMCWVPKFYYKINVNAVDVQGVKTYDTRFDAEAAGYALHRAFIDGGIEQDGFFIDKFQASKNPLGTGFVASSIQGGLPISTAADHNPIADLTACGSNVYWESINACKARDGADGAVNVSSRFHVVSRYQWAALALLSLAHGQAATSETNCAWYSAGTTNFPKGNNNNALKDTNDTTVTYVSDGYSNCGKTGSGTPFAKTTHNGQACGIADVNGNMYDLNIGLTCIAGTKAISAATQANPCQLTVVGHGLTTGAQVMITSVVGMTELNDKIFAVTVVDPDTITLDGVDSTGFTAYSSAGTLTFGTFYAAKESARMRDFTAGNTLATDHWGATGVAAMMDAFDIAFETAYPNNGFSQRMGDGAGQVLSAAASGNGWLLTGMGLPGDAGGISTAGTNLFGTDYFYQYIRNEVFLLSSLFWSYGSTAGVWGLYLNNSRAGSVSGVGFRAAAYPD